MQDYPKFLSAFEKRFSAYLEKQQSQYQRLLPHDSIQKYVSLIPELAQGGKRIRPYIAWASSNTEISAVQEQDWSIYTALEVVHLFALVHDDLVDQSPQRRGVPTAHTSITTILNDQQAIGDTSFSGRMQALLLGDLIFWSAHDLIVQHPKQKELSQCFSALINNTILGQMLDFDQTNRASVSSSDIATKTNHKTSYYTFTYPMRVGCILGGIQTENETLSVIGQHIGQGFQIQDDMLDIIGDPNKTKKPIFSDIASGQHTILTSYIRNQTKPEHKDVLESAWRQEVHEKHIPLLQNMFISSGAITFAKEKASEHYHKALAEINTSQLPQQIKQRLVDLVNHLQKRDF